MNDQSKNLLEVMEAKYAAMLDIVNDIAMIHMRDTPERAGLQNYIFLQRQEIHAAASKLNGGK